MSANNILTTERLARQRVSGSLRDLAGAAEHLLMVAQRSGNERFDAARDALERQVDFVKTEFTDLEAGAEFQAKRAVRWTAHAMRDHPYAAAGIAVGAGVLIGVLIARR
jgi:ElaB/YqjD/DUF883 family membrane-anchored ribosome-binding protein